MSGKCLYRVNLWSRLLQIIATMYGIVGSITVLLNVEGFVVAVSVQSSVFAVLLLVGLILQVSIKKFRSCLVRQSEDRSDIIKFAFTCGNLAQSHLANFRAKSQKSVFTAQVSSRIPNISESSAHPISSDSVVLAI